MVIRVTKSKLATEVVHVERMGKLKKAHQTLMGKLNERG